MAGILPVHAWGPPTRPTNPPRTFAVPVTGTSTRTYGRRTITYCQWPETFRLGRKARRGGKGHLNARKHWRNGICMHRAWNGGGTAAERHLWELAQRRLNARYG